LPTDAITFHNASTVGGNLVMLHDARG